MTWVKLDDKFHRNPKQLRMSDAAFRAYVCCLSYAADMPRGQITGFLTEVEVRQQGAQPKVVQELVELNAWEKVDGGFLIHDFEQFLPQSSTDKVRTWRENKRNQPVTVTRQQGNGSGQPAQPRGKGSSHARAHPEPEPVPVPDNAPPDPPRAKPRATDAVDINHDLGLQLAVRTGEVLKRDLSATEIAEAAQFVDDFAYLSVDDMVDRMKDHLEHCSKAKLPTPRTVHGFRETLRIENEFRADHRSPKAWRPRPVAGDLVSVGETLRNRYATAPEEPKQSTAP